MNISTIVILVILVLVCVYGIKAYMKRLSSGCCGAGGSAVKRVKTEHKKPSEYQYKHTVYIEGMFCRNCAVRVENAFAENGIYAKVKDDRAEIYADSEQDREKLRRIVRGAGYTPAKISVSEIHTK